MKIDDLLPLLGLYTDDARVVAIVGRCESEMCDPDVVHQDIPIAQNASVRMTLPQVLHDLECDVRQAKASKRVCEAIMMRSESITDGPSIELPAGVEWGMPAAELVALWGVPSRRSLLTDPQSWVRFDRPGASLFAYFGLSDGNPRRGLQMLIWNMPGRDFA
jgi:hypothetical protein